MSFGWIAVCCCCLLVCCILFTFVFDWGLYLLYVLLCLTASGFVMLHGLFCLLLCFVFVLMFAFDLRIV